MPELHHVADLGPSADLTPEVISAIAARAGPGSLCAMIHPSAAGVDPALDAARGAGLDMVRIVYHSSWKDAFAALADKARSAGLVVAGNIALASRYTFETLVKMSGDIAPRVDMVYFADTCGALFPDEISRIVEATRGSAEIGFHGHDYLSMALANAHAAAQTGARWIDASVHGIGRGAGNLRLELWLALRHAHGPAKAAKLVELLPALSVIESRLGAPLSPDLASLVSGALNLTPPQEDELRAAAQQGGAAPLADLALRLLEHAADDAPITELLETCRGDVGGPGPS